MDTPPTSETPCRTDHLYMPENHMEQLYNSENPVVKFFHLGRLRAIAKQIPRSSNLKVLDAGCGEGHLLRILYEDEPGGQYYGADITEVALERARSRCPFARLNRTSLLHTGYPDGFFDVIVCTEVLEHIYEYQDVLRELKRILKLGGLFIVTFPNEFIWTLGRFILGRRPVKVPDHVASFVPKTMKSLVGLKPIKRVHFPRWLPFFLSTGALMEFEKEDF